MQILPLAAALCLSLAAAQAQVPMGPHEAALEQHRGEPVLAALVGDGGPPTTWPEPRARPAADGRAVFGYLPYWIDAAYYRDIDWSVLTHVGAFSVEIEPDGTVGEAHGWPWTALVDTAHAHGVRVILTATLFGDESVLALIGADEHRRTFFGQMRDLMAAGRADGLNVDFEGPATNGWTDLINGFMAELTAYLHGEIPGCEVSFAAPAVDWGGRWDQVGLAASCDYLFIMGYAFSGSWSAESGPTAPLTGGWRNITTTVTDERDYGEVAGRSPEKLILGVPYYGCEWVTSGPEPRAATEEFVQYPRLAQALPGAAEHGRQWDAESSTAWYRYQDGGQWYQVWYDDAVSLSLKYDLALQNDLLGVGVWALGYEGDRREPWEVLALKMGRRVPGTVVAEAGAPDRFSLRQSYPNPFNGAVRIEYVIQAPGAVRLEVLDALGRVVQRWQRQHGRPDMHSWTWDGLTRAGHPAASGLYFYRLTHRDARGATRQRTRRMVLVR